MESESLVCWMFDEHTVSTSLVPRSPLPGKYSGMCFFVILYCLPFIFHPLTLYFSQFTQLPRTTEENFHPSEIRVCIICDPWIHIRTQSKYSVFNYLSWLLTLLISNFNFFWNHRGFSHLQFFFFWFGLVSFCFYHKITYTIHISFSFLIFIIIEVWLAYKIIYY